MMEYIQHNYGTCRLERCLCRDPHNPRYGGWVGKLCPDWMPTSATNWEELKEYMSETRKV